MWVIRRNWVNCRTKKKTLSFVDVWTVNRWLVTERFKHTLTGEHWFSFAWFTHETNQCNHNYEEKDPKYFHFHHVYRSVCSKNEFSHDKIRKACGSMWELEILSTQKHSQNWQQNWLNQFPRSTLVRLTQQDFNHFFVDALKRMIDHYTKKECFNSNDTFSLFS